MKISTLSAALLGALIAGGGVYSHFHFKNTAPSLEQLQLDQQQSGEITSQSLLNVSDGVRSAIYELNLEADQLIQAKVSGPLPAQLSVLYQDQLLERAPVKEGCNSCSSSTNTNAILVFKAPSTGSYQLAVSGKDKSAYGPFNIQISELKQLAGTTLQPDSSIDDWAQNKPQSYPLHISTDGLYVIDLKAITPNLDLLLKLKNNENSVLAEDDDGGTDLNSRITRYLKAGDYVLEASSATGDEQFTGGYTLSITQQELSPQAQQLNNLGDELILDGVRRSGLYTDQMTPFHFELSRPQIVTVRLHADNFNGQLKLGPYQSRHSGQHNAQQIRALLPAGEHVVELHGENQSGLYELWAQAENTTLSQSAQPLPLNQRTAASINHLVDGDLYTVVISEAGQYVFHMDATQFDSYLQLFHEQQLLAEDDDNGGDLNAELTVWLEPGEYRVLATSFEPTSQAYPYGLSVYAK